MTVTLVATPATNAYADPDCAPERWVLVKEGTGGRSCSYYVSDHGRVKSVKPCGVQDGRMRFSVNKKYMTVRCADVANVHSGSDAWEVLDVLPEGYEANKDGVARRVSYVKPVKVRQTRSDKNKHTAALQVSLGRGDRRYIHHLVTEAFIGPRPADNEVDHINGRPWDNRLENLRYVTHSANMVNRARREDYGLECHTHGFSVRFQRYKKQHYVGYYKTKEEAIAARDAKLAELDKDGAYRRT